MTRLIAVFYILSALYGSPNPQAISSADYYSRLVPDSTSIAASADPTAGAPTVTTPSSTTPASITAPPDPSAGAIDYAAELKNLGFYKEDSTDKALNLRNAVVRFQSCFNLQVDGIWGDGSVNALINRLSIPSYTFEDTVTTPPTKGKWITVNKTKRILTLYNGGTVVKKYPVAVGNPPSLTPDGKFTMVSRVVNPTWGGGGYAKPVKGGSPQNPLGYRWMGLSYGNGSTLGIHGNNSPYSIGKNVSHGCIRMINSDVEELFTLVSVKMPVWVGTESNLESWGVKQPAYCEPLSEDF